MLPELEHVKLTQAFLRDAGCLTEDDILDLWDEIATKRLHRYIGRMRQHDRVGLRMGEHIILARRDFKDSRLIALIAVFPKSWAKKRWRNTHLVDLHELERGPSERHTAPQAQAQTA